MIEYSPIISVCGGEFIPDHRWPEQGRTVAGNRKKAPDQAVEGVFQGNPRGWDNASAQHGLSAQLALVGGLGRLLLANGLDEV
jgi:hypothetical protein